MGGIEKQSVEYLLARLSSAYADAILGINTYCYVFLNIDTREAYATMFKETFRILCEVGRFTLKVSHIHIGEEGIEAITADMCKKQAGGKHILKII